MKEAASVVGEKPISGSRRLGNFFVRCKQVWTKRCLSRSRMIVLVKILFDGLSFVRNTNVVLCYPSWSDIERQSSLLAVQMSALFASSVCSGL